MEKWGMIGTWRMSLEGIKNSKELIKKDSINAVIQAIKIVEDYPFYKSVGFGGLPNEDGVVQLDAAFMNGDTMQIGAIAAIEDFESPIEIAYSLSLNHYNTFLVGEGAKKYALKNNFKQKKMLSNRAYKIYEIRKKDIQEKGLSPYSGHDTVCILGVDNQGSVMAGASTSGLFMKKSGRVGDSPISGSGYYANSNLGAAAATGLGEDIMKTCISFDIVRLMEKLKPQEAVDLALDNALKLLKNDHGDISVVCINNKGEFGAATSTNEFSYVVCNEFNEPTVFLVNSKKEHQKASKEWLEAYYKKTHKKIGE